MAENSRFFKKVVRIVRGMMTILRKPEIIGYGGATTNMKEQWTEQLEAGTAVYRNY